MPLWCNRSMAHCAEINPQTGKVLRVIVTLDEYPDGRGGVLTCEQWCEKTFGGVWKQTSYNTVGGKHLKGGKPFRKNFAGIGYTYDPQRDAFIPPKPEDGKEYKLKEETCLWEEVK